MPEDSGVDNGGLFECASASAVLLTANLTRGPKTNVKAPENPPPHRFRIRMGIPVLHEMLQDFLRIIRHRDPSQCIGTSRWCECNHPDGDIFQQRTSCVYPRLQSLCAKLSIQDEVQLVRIVVILMEVFSNSKTHTKPKNET